MRSVTHVALTAAFLWCGTVCSSIAASVANNAAERFGALPLFRSATLSPGGKYLAFDRLIDGIYSLVIMELASPGNIKGYHFGDNSVARFYWKDDDHLLATKRWPQGSFNYRYSTWTAASSFETSALVISAGGTERPRLSVRTGKVGVIARTDNIASLAHDDPKHFYLSVFGVFQPNLRALPENFTHNLYRVGMDSGEIEPVRKGEPETARWLIDSNGGVIARIDSRPYQDEILVPDAEGFRPVSTFDYEDKKARNRIAGLTEDGRSVAVLARRENNRLGLYPISLKDGRWGPALFFNPDQDIVDVIRDERSFRVIGVTYDENNPKSFYLASEHQRLQKQVEDLYPGRTAFIVSTASDRSKSLVLTSGPKNPPALQFVDLQASRIDTIAESYPQLRDTPLAEVQRYEYRSDDGTTLTGLLTLPPGRDGHNLPTVVLPAGGFGYRDVHFDWFVQFLANRGYAVFQSGTRDRKQLANASNMDEFGELALATQQDITLGVDDLIAKGIADPKRICIAGAANAGIAAGSGGYVALLAGIFAPERYACIISYDAISELSTVFNDARRTTTAFYKFFGVEGYDSTLVGNSASYERAEMERFSPSKNAAAVRVPILLMHSWDQQAGIQSRAMKDAMTRARKQAELLRLPGDDGTLSRAESRIALLTAVSNFLALHIGN